MRTKIKTLRAKLVAEPAKTEAELKIAVAAIDKAVQKGVIKKQAASRTVSRLTIAAAAAKNPG
jgi:ribosomal protein S20